MAKRRIDTNAPVGGTVRFCPRGAHRRAGRDQPVLARGRRRRDPVPGRRLPPDPGEPARRRRGLRALGMDSADVIKTRIYLADPPHWVEPAKRTPRCSTSPPRARLRLHERLLPPRHRRRGRGHRLPPRSLMPRLSARSAPRRGAGARHAARGAARAAASTGAGTSSRRRRRRADQPRLPARGLAATIRCRCWRWRVDRARPGRGPARLARWAGAGDRVAAMSSCSARCRCW